MPKPEIVIEPERQPNSWLVGLSRERARLHVTRGLLELLTPAELEAVVGHELAHLVNRDAAVMTAVGGPGAVLLDGGKRMLRGGWWSRSWAAWSPRASGACRCWAPRSSRAIASSRPTPDRPR